MGFPNYFSTYKLSDGSLVNVNILDTVGQEKFKAVSESYYKRADCCLLVYDISSRKSFDECKNYYNINIKERCKKNVKVILLGNKTDLEENREIKPEEGAGLSLENDYIFMETSCLKNENVASAFETLIEMNNIEAKRSQNNNKNPDNVKLKYQKTKKKACICPIFN